MARLHHRQRLGSFLRSRMLSVSLLVVAGFVSLALGREVARLVSVRQELNRLTKEITVAERSTKELEQLIVTLKSPTFQEGAARTRLNLQKPGEKVLVIPNLQSLPPPPSLTPDETEQSPGTPNPVTNTRRWWEFLFTKEPS